MTTSQDKNIPLWCLTNPKNSYSFLRLASEYLKKTELLRDLSPSSSPFRALNGIYVRVFDGLKQYVSDRDSGSSPCVGFHPRVDFMYGRHQGCKFLKRVQGYPSCRCVAWCGSCHMFRMSPLFRVFSWFAARQATRRWIPPKLCYGVHRLPLSYVLDDPNWVENIQDPDSPTYRRLSRELRYSSALKFNPSNAGPNKIKYAFGAAAGKSFVVESDEVRVYYWYLKTAVRSPRKHPALEKPDGEIVAKGSHHILDLQAFAQLSASEMAVWLSQLIPGTSHSVILPKSLQVALLSVESPSVLSYYGCFRNNSKARLEGAVADYCPLRKGSSGPYHLNSVDPLTVGWKHQLDGNARSFLPYGK